MIKYLNLNRKPAGLARTFSGKKVGFTLIEIMVVIAVIGILTALILAGLVRVRYKAKDAKIKQYVTQVLIRAQEIYELNCDRGRCVYHDFDETCSDCLSAQCALPTGWPDPMFEENCPDPTMRALARKTAELSEGGEEGIMMFYVGPHQDGQTYCAQFTGLNLEESFCRDSAGNATSEYLCDTGDTFLCAQEVEPPPEYMAPAPFPSFLFPR